jgi:hypothetical protein
MVLVLLRSALSMRLGTVLWSSKKVEAAEKSEKFRVRGLEECEWVLALL